MTIEEAAAHIEAASTPQNHFDLLRLFQLSILRGLTLTGDRGRTLLILLDIQQGGTGDPKKALSALGLPLEFNEMSGIRFLDKEKP
jgi:hypothetical protein